MVISGLLESQKQYLCSTIIYDRCLCLANSNIQNDKIVKDSILLINMLVVYQSCIYFYKKFVHNHIQLINSKYLVNAPCYMQKYINKTKVGGSGHTDP